MKRRQFIKKGALTGSLFAFGGTLAAGELITSEATLAHTFNLNYAPHLGMFKMHAGEDAVAQLEFMAANGFKAFEDNDMRLRPYEEQNRMAATMRLLGIQMGVFVAHKIYWKEANLTSGKIAWRDEFLDDIRKSVEIAKRVSAKWMTVVPGHVDLRLNKNFQTANVIESLKQASAILEPHGLIMVLEPLNYRDHPGMFLTESPQAYEICKAVDSPSCKILFDIYHQQVQEGNLIPNIENCWDEIAYFQTGDNPGRNEPSTGEINYRNVFKFIHEKDYNGILGMEHGNSMNGLKGEQAVIDAYLKADDFI